MRSPSPDPSSPRGGAAWAIHAWPFAAWTAYVALFPALYREVGVTAAAAAFLIVALAGATGGARAGLLHAVLSLAAVVLAFERVNGGVVDPRLLLTSGSLTLLVSLAIGGLVGRLRDLERLLRRQRAQLEFRARHDALTGLLNREAFMADVEAALAPNAAGGGRVDVVFVDLDGFKGVNDAFGHAAGDEVLREFARRARANAAPGVTWGRLSGDEFALLRIAGAASDPRAPERDARADVDAILRDPFEVGAARVAVGASHGVATAAPGTASGDALLALADARMYEHKRRRDAER